MTNKTFLSVYGVEGEFALIGASLVVTRDVSPHALVFGNPARQHGYICCCARRLSHEHESRLAGKCGMCNQCL